MTKTERNYTHEYNDQRRWERCNIVLNEPDDYGYIVVKIDTGEYVMAHFLSVREINTSKGQRND